MEDCTAQQQTNYNYIHQREESYQHNVEQGKPDTKDTFKYGSTYLKFQNRQN